MVVLAREVNDLRHFRLRNLVGVDAADPNPFLVHVQHNSRRFLAVFSKKPLKNVNDELHGRVIVVQKQNLVQGRFFCFWLGLGYDANAIVVVTGLAGVAHCFSNGTSLGLSCY